MKTYSSKSNCKRAALAELGPDAIEGKDFTLAEADGAWTFKPKAAAAKKPAEEDPARIGAVRDAQAQAAASDPEARRAGLAKLKRLGVAPPAESEQTEPAAARQKGAAKLAGAGSKQDQVLALLRRKDGASADEIGKAMDWQRHTVRGFIAGAVKKKLGLAVTAEDVEGRGRVYRVAA